MNLRDELLKKAEEMAAAKLGMDPKQVEDEIGSLLKQGGSNDDDSGKRESSDDADDKPSRRRAASDD